MQDCKLNAIADMVHGFAAIVEGTTRPIVDAPEEDPLHSVAALYQTRASSAHSHLLGLPDSMRAIARGCTH